MVFEITSGKIAKAQKVIIYGPEGVGKTTLASQFPDPLFSDIEGGTWHLDVRRLPSPTSWTLLQEEAQYVRDTPGLCSSYVIDTADWAEHYCTEHICSKAKKDGIEDFGYGKGYIYLAEEFGRWLNLLTEIVERGVNVVVCAHAIVRTTESPDELGSYDRYELKLGKKTVAPLLKEWADLLLFCNYKTTVFKEAADNKKSKAQGGKKRVMYTSHCAAWDAKNRHGLPDELPMEYAAIAQCFAATAPAASVQAAKPQTPPPAKPAAPANAPAPAPALKPAPQVSTPVGEQVKFTDLADPEELAKLPKTLTDLMQADGVTLEEIKTLTANAGYYTYGTSVDVWIKDGYIDGFLVPNWKSVVEKARAYTVPF